MTQGQHLALGLVIAILIMEWVLPDKNGRSKLLAIVNAATGSNIQLPNVPGAPGSMNNGFALPPSGISGVQKHGLQGT